MAPDIPSPEIPERVRVRFTAEHEDAGVLHQPGQEAWVAPASADYIETVAKSGHRVTPDAPATEPPRSAARAVAKE